MTVEATHTKVPDRLTLVLAAFLLAHGGVLEKVTAKGYIRMSRKVDCEQWPLRRLVGMAIRPLLDDGLVESVGDVWYVPDLTDLAAWLADGHEAREDAGMKVEPGIPAQRAAAAA